MQAIVTIDFYFRSQDDAVQARYLPGDVLSGDMAETAVSGGWAQLQPEPPPPPPPGDKKPVAGAPENKGV
jgi:hypothetical protein